ncbi:hypothetical protein NMG60_11027631 [Bertholletia excelsa]
MMSLNLEAFENFRLSDTDATPRTAENVDDPAELKAMQLPDPLVASKVVRLLYTNSGSAVLALSSSNAVHKLWKWQHTNNNPSAMSTASIIPQMWQPQLGALMTNDLGDRTSIKESTACFAISKNDSYLISASGGNVSLFNMVTFKIMTTFMAPPPVVSYLAFYPLDNNIIAVGMDDSTIQIYNVRVDEVKAKLKGHHARITGLAFSRTLDVLVSSGADAQLYMWDIHEWEKKIARPLQAPPGHPSPLVGETKVQFHKDQICILVVHESQIAVYGSQLECLHLWYPRPRDTLSSAISSAVYSCNGQLIFAGFSDGAIGVFNADSFSLQCRIAPSAYIPPSIGSRSRSRSRRNNAFPVEIAAHPCKPNQFALGMSDGAVHVIEPLDTEPKWGDMVPR